MVPLCEQPSGHKHNNHNNHNESGHGYLVFTEASVNPSTPAKIANLP